MFVFYLFYLDFTFSQQYQKKLDKMLHSFIVALAIFYFLFLF